MLLPIVVLVAQSVVPAPTATAPTPAAEPRVAAALEEIRKAELFLDADALAAQLAASFTLVENGTRVSGAFAFVEPVRRLRERGVQVRDLVYDQVIIKVYGGSAIASYAYSRAWRDGRGRHREHGWSSDVFELRDDGRWLMVHRHRCTGTR